MGADITRSGLLGPRLAVTVTLITVVSVILGLAASLAISVAKLATVLPTYQASFSQLTDELRALLSSLGVGPDELQAALSKINLANVADLLLGMLSGLAGAFSTMLLLLFIAAFMTLDAVGFAGRLPRIRRERPEVTGALDSFVRGTRSYIPRRPPRRRTQDPTPPRAAPSPPTTG